MASPAPTPRPGDQLASTTSSTRVIVIRAPEEEVGTIACGGATMVPAQSVPAQPASGGAPGALIGKRYVDDADTLELLCTASGGGELTYDGAPLTIRAPKALPASD
ncbi:hypothetical protein [Streptomyces sp. NBC_01358]|uniref:hypothetical protein n=1 Tax=Streptomyces sp. NBC_01358 TaxID=2903837 RepID=UPI002E317740|nr:hypothetical protein [Streptomyces sp. NBC_01358]